MEVFPRQDAPVTQDVTCLSIKTAAAVTEFSVNDPLFTSSAKCARETKPTTDTIMKPLHPKTPQTPKKCILTQERLKK
eukprot:6459629-Amphidinium_carterae.1